MILLKIVYMKWIMLEDLCNFIKINNMKKINKIPLNKVKNQIFLKLTVVQMNL